MINFKEKSIIILPHLDDEFALTPILNIFSKKSDPNKIKILYCCERRSGKNKKYFLKRRMENVKALKLFKINKEQIIYLNDFCYSNDLEIANNFKQISYYIKNIFKDFNFSQVLTLSYEGGHPDHDALALIVKRFAEVKKIKTYFFPSYNYERNLFFPFTILKPLRSQKDIFKYYSISKFCWINSLRIALIYKSEYEAFLKLIPFLIYNTLFIDGIYISDNIDVDLVDWNKSLCNTRYKKTKKEI
tara:strand:+ start:951 stop:1685 length:735 start_codon:yes stop_codon:yes gene_type:complete